MNQRDYIRLSLELHLFFDRIMKEHSFFLEAAFMEKEKEFKEIANYFQKTFSDILMEIVPLANGNITNDFFTSGEMVTNNTLEAENKSSTLSGIAINTDITKKEIELRSGNIVVDTQLLNSISRINRKTLPIIQNLIDFKNDILDHVLSCEMFTTNYPLLIAHIRNEANMYYELLRKVESREVFTEDYVYEQEVFWNTIMMEHAQFIRGLLDPTEKDLFQMANQYAKDYEVIIQNFVNPINLGNLTNISLQKTIDFRNFKIAGEEGILNCEIKSIIIPLLADHVVREANHFIRILRSFSMK